MPRWIKDRRLTPSGKMERSSSVIVEWISKAWKKFQSVLFQNHFQSACLSDAENGTEGGVLWDVGEQSGGGASSSENEGATEKDSFTYTNRK